MTSESRLNDSMEDALIEAVRDSRRPVAPAPKSPQETSEEAQRKKEAYFNLAMQLDALAERQEARHKAEKAALGILATTSCFILATNKPSTFFIFSSYSECYSTLSNTFHTWLCCSVIFFFHLYSCNTFT